MCVDARTSDDDEQVVHHHHRGQIRRAARKIEMGLPEEIAPSGIARGALETDQQGTSDQGEGRD
jgi:hypothetical protein